MAFIVKLSTEEINAVGELKLRMKNDLHPILSEDETIFYRFLKARDFNVDRAEKMLRKHIQWRKAHQIDTILEDFKPKEVFCKYIEPRVIGPDKDGDLVTYLQLGKMHSNDILSCIKLNDDLKHFFWSFEKLNAAMKYEYEKTGRYPFQASNILDLDELTFANATSKTAIEFLLSIFNTLQDNFPERVKSIYVINAPSLYIFAFSVLKTALSNATIKKVHVHGHSDSKEKLLEIMDSGVLPAFLGGNRTDPDGNPLCKTVVTHIGKISPRYRLSNEERYFQNVTQVKKVSLSPGQKTEINVEVAENRSVIEWEFLVRGKDIGFGLDFHTSNQRIEILPTEKIATSDGTEEGSFKCKTIGKYSIIFDNSHSWMSSKEVEYIINVTRIQ